MYARGNEQHKWNGFVGFRAPPHPMGKIALEAALSPSNRWEHAGAGASDVALSQALDLRGEKEQAIVG